MTKKILALFMAALLALSVFALAVYAEEEEPAYTPVEYQIADLVAAFEDGEDVFLQPTDVILLGEKPQAEEPDEPVEAAEEEPEVPAADANAISSVLIVEYLPGKDAASTNENTKYVDYDGSGYAIQAIGGNTDYAYKNNERRENYAIDYQNENEYAFVQWKIVGIYSGKEFNRIVLEAQWNEPALTGWAGFMAMRRAYLKTIIDYVIKFLQDWFSQLGQFISGSAD
ncbi:MAG: hypothetical protein IJT44_05500 [Clostridia bacterium]|nr:hypothetical protein [Clostridia bacterium]